MEGYNKDFLDGIELPMPQFGPGLSGSVLHKNELRDGIYADYIHYTIVMNRELRTPILAALNIDQNLLRGTSRGRWDVDSRIGGEFQLNNDYYRRNPWDRGHMARRASTSWGENSRIAQRASDETMYYSNSCLQHENLNQDEWLALEDWVLKLKLDKDGKITSFSGPIKGNYGRTITPSGRKPAMIPSGFFKVVCFINKETEELDVRAFIQWQDVNALKDKRGKRVFNFQTYQVTVSEVEQWTGLNFADEIYEKNPLYFRENPEARMRLNISHFPERHEVDRPEEIYDSNTTRPWLSDDDVEVYIAGAMVNPKGDERSGEWISILNLSDVDVDLTDWTLSDTRRGDLNIGGVLEQGKQIIAPGEAVSVKPISPLMLGNNGGTIVLKDNQGRRIDRVKYTKSQGKIQGLPIRFVESF